MSEQDQPPGRKDLPRVVILGGGMAGLAAAFELSRPGWERQFQSITVYERSWRLGGKGASGRADYCDRIEEHGLHIWLGFYVNAFRMMRECYDELRRPSGAPLRFVEDAFEPASVFMVREQRGDAWLPWLATFPEPGGLPGDPGHGVPTLWECVQNALRLALRFLVSVQQGPAAGRGPRPSVGIVPGPAGTPGAVRVVPAGGLRDRVRPAVAGQLLEEFALPTIEAALYAALDFASSLDGDPRRHRAEDHAFLRGLVERAAEVVRHHIPDPDALADAARREWYLADILLACVRGVLRHGLLQRGLDAIDDYEFSDWLRFNGASEDAVGCPLIRCAVYNLAFAYRDGDPNQPAASAATALRGLVRFFLTYRGAIAWRMKAGMGDVVFAPLYQVLRRRGVDIELLHRVDKLALSGDGKRIASIKISRLAHVDQGVAKDTDFPFVDVGGLPCWPNQPLAGKFTLAQGVAADDLEHEGWRVAAVGLAPVQLRQQDVVVLAIPVGALPQICGDLIQRNAAWKNMVAKLGTVRTQSFQLWLTRSLPDCGCDWPQAVDGGFEEPFDTYADMCQLIDRESWPPGRVKGIAYFCNAMEDDPNVVTQDEADACVMQAAREFLATRMPELWPGAAHLYPTEFRWDLLVDPDNPDSKDGFDAQFFRANVDPSERYVQSLPKTAKYRLAPGKSGFDNLFLAGDWTQCGLNVGCIESAVISGVLAACAVEERPPEDRIVGWNGW